jgi:hypothetical protein
MILESSSALATTDISSKQAVSNLHQSDEEEDSLQESKQDSCALHHSLDATFGKEDFVALFSAIQSVLDILIPTAQRLERVEALLMEPRNKVSGSASWS